MTDKQQPAQFDWATELSDVQGHVTLSEQEAHEIGARLRSLHAYCMELEAQVIRDCMTNVQNPAEIEHVAGVVSKNGAESNMNAYAEMPPNVGEYKYGGGLYTDAQMRAFADATHALRTQQPAPATQQAPQQEAQEAQEPVAWYVTGCGRLLDEDEAKAEARHIGGTARAMPLYTAPQADSQPAPVRDERDDFEKVFPLPSGCIRVGTGYASTGYCNWPAHTHCERWQGWQARAARATADSVQEDAARYRYLRDGDWREHEELESVIRLQLNTLWDAKIDAARAAQEGKSHGN